MQQDHDPVPRITLRDENRVPQLGFGTLAVQPDRESSAANAETTSQIVTQALSAGYRHIDTAQSYGTERGVGKAVAAAGIPREQLFLASKLANPNHAPDDVRRSVEQTLTNLGIDQIDLFLIHWPLPTLYGGDYVSPWATLTEMVAEGLIRSAGVSNFQPAHLDRLVTETGIAPIVNQVEMHPYFANHPVQEACRRHGIALEAHSPLGHNREPLTDDTIGRIAEAHGRSPAQVILRWHIQHGRIAIPKSTRPERMAENISVFDFELNREHMGLIDALDRGPGGRVGPNPDTYEG